MLISWEAVSEWGTTKTGDTPGSYLDAKASGRPAFITLDRKTQRLLAPHWLKLGDPYSRVDAAAYGLPRSD